MSPPHCIGSLRHALGLAAVALAALGCAVRPSADFELLYAGRSVVTQRTPLIVIPGVLGSRLARRDNGREIWPGGAAALLTGRSFAALAPAGDDPLAGRDGAPLAPGGLFDGFAGSSFYGDLVDALERFGGYRCVAPTAITARTDCVLFDWDWRQDFVAAAARLGETIAALGRARFDPELRVDVLAHSAGGLVARYYLSYGSADVLATAIPPAPDGRGRGIDRLLLVGTPNFGAIAAVQDAMFGKRFPLGRAGAEVVDSFPGIAQLFPHPELGWMIEPDGLPAELDLFAIATWREHHVGPFSPAVERRLGRRATDRATAARDLARRRERFALYLERGERFQRALARPLTATDATIHVFGAGCRETPARCLVERDGETLRLVARPGDIRHPRPEVDYRQLMFEPGDGTVTKSSLLGVASLVDGAPAVPVFPVRSAVFICAPHQSLGTDPTFLDNLLHTLLYRDAAAARGEHPDTAPDS